jgi:VanZ family protein
MTHAAPPRERSVSSTRGRPVAVVAAVLAVLVQLWGLYRVTGPPTAPWFPNADKVEHFLGFAVPVFLVLLACWLGRTMRTRTIVVVAVVFAAHAVLSEIIQHNFYRERSGDPLDVLADWSGIIVGVCGLLIVSRRGREVERENRAR